MGRCKYSKGHRILNNYDDALERAIYKVNKNYQDMDVRNNTVQRDIEQIIECMVNECRSIQGQVKNTGLR